MSEPGRQRVCIICGESLEGRRADARCCSGACRAEASRLRAILGSADRVDFGSIAERLARRRKKQAVGAS